MDIIKNYDESIEKLYHPENFEPLQQDSELEADVFEEDLETE